MTTEQSADGVKILTKVEKGSNRHWKNFLDKDYLGSHNLEKGEEMLLTIEKFVGEEDVKTQDGTKQKQVLYFKEDVPKMIMNITNGNTLTALYGSHPEQWVGKQIQVYAASVRAFGKNQDALRIRDFIPKVKVNIVEYADKLMEAKSLADLKRIWESFPMRAKSDPEILRRKDEIKSQLN